MKEAYFYDRSCLKHNGCC